MGSPEFALPCLEQVHQQTELLAVFTQPDKPRARGNKMLPTPVKARALELGLPVHEPARIRDPQVLDLLEKLAPDVILVVAYAKLIPKSLLDLPRFGCINVHPSLLSRYRGAIPIQAALMNGDTETGVCTFFMDEGYDTGDVILTRRVPIAPDDNGETLAARLSLLGAEVLKETIESLERGDYTRTPQPAEPETPYAKVLSKSDLLLDWSRDAVTLGNQVRALALEPGAGTPWKGGVLKIGKAAALEQAEHDHPPGSVIGPLKGLGFAVACGSGTALAIESVKPPGKSWMSAWSFWQGNALQPGQLLSAEA